MQYLTTFPGKVRVVSVDEIKLFGNSDDINVSRYDSSDCDFKAICVSMETCVKDYQAQVKSLLVAQSNDTASTSQVSALRCSFALIDQLVSFHRKF